MRCTRWLSKLMGRTRCLRLESLESRALLHAEGILSGYAFIDSDNDGSRDLNEAGIPGVLVRISQADSTDNATERSTLTDDRGRYEFDELNPGTYEISQRQPSAFQDGEDSTANPDAMKTNDVFTNVVLADDQMSQENNFGERRLRAKVIGARWFLASTPPNHEILRTTVAVAEEIAGDEVLAQSIRESSLIPNARPTATDDIFSVNEDEELIVHDPGVLGNDSDPDGDRLTANLVSEPTDGSVALEVDGSFTYTPDPDFSGTDSFAYAANDGLTSSNVATVSIRVNPVDEPVDPGNERLFGPVTSGPVDAPELLGIRTDLEPGAPPIARDHVNTAVDYSAYSNPPTYGPHHGFLVEGGVSITPRPTGVYQTEQADEDLIHNLEHGHVWISYNPELISNEDLDALEQLVIDGGVNTGVILTPRSANSSAIALASWLHLLELNSFDDTQIRDFVETNRGHSPEGFIRGGQKPEGREVFDDSLPHTINS